MRPDPWLPIGLRVGSTALGRVLHEGAGWQVYAGTHEDARVLVSEPSLASRWVASGLIPEGALVSVSLGSHQFEALPSGPNHLLSGVECCPSPEDLDDALSFASSLRRTRELLPNGSLQGGVFVERYSIILPAAHQQERANDSVLLGSFLTGGVPVPVEESARLTSILSWLPPGKVLDVCRAAGLTIQDQAVGSRSDVQATPQGFRLPGRPALEAFFREHVIEIVQQPERYAALGIGFPGAIVLHGPPGTGKTFAVDRLVEYLHWPRFEVSSTSVGSPYIHDTSRKIGNVFAAAAERAPSLIVIDEMEAFLTDRSTADGSAVHHVEEVAEFLRWIPKAAESRVLVVAMTNRLDTIDPAVLRRGRFDHVIEVGVATGEEIEELLESLLREIPHATDVDAASVAQALVGRPLSDVAFVLREAGRLAARNGRAAVDMNALEQAVRGLVERANRSSGKREIGFSS